jgi:hypothetical protein
LFLIGACGILPACGNQSPQPDNNTARVTAPPAPPAPLNGRYDGIMQSTRGPTTTCGTQDMASFQIVDGSAITCSVSRKRRGNHRSRLTRSSRTTDRFRHHQVLPISAVRSVRGTCKARLAAMRADTPLKPTEQGPGSMSTGNSVGSAIMHPDREEVTELAAQRRWLLAALAITCQSMAGCSGSGEFRAPAVVLDTPAGPTPIYTPSPTMPGGLAAPPPGLEPASGTIVQSADRSGTYTGTAVPLETGGGLCITTEPVSGFHVRGNAVRFGGFRGTISADNGLQMVYGNQWIIGQFEGSTFHGQFDVPGRFGAPQCTFMLSLERTGP